MIKLSESSLKDGARDAVLAALDEYMQLQTECPKARGARDEDLPALFRALDAHMDRVAARFNHPESREPGSANFRVIYPE